MFSSNRRLLLPLSAALATAAMACGPGPLPTFPPHAPAPVVVVSARAIERQLRAEGVTNVVVVAGPAGPGTDELVVTLSPAPAAFQRPSMAKSDAEDYLVAHREMLGLGRLGDGHWGPQRPGLFRFEEERPSIESGCARIEVMVEFERSANFVFARIIRTCFRRNRRAPDYASRPLPAMPAGLKGVVLECTAAGGGGAVIVVVGSMVDDYGDLYAHDSLAFPVGDYVRTIPPKEMEKAMGLLVLAKDEAEIEFVIDMNKDRNAPLSGHCTGTLPTGKVWLGTPSEPGRRGPATRALLRWIQGHGIFPEL